jgi:hypothetical protein
MTEKGFVSVGSFYHHCVQRLVTINFLRNVQMRIVSHWQHETSELVVDLRKFEPILKNF